MSRVRLAPLSASTSVARSQAFAFRVVPLLRLPGRSLFPGDTPAHEARAPGPRARQRMSHARGVDAEGWEQVELSLRKTNPSDDSEQCVCRRGRLAGGR